MRDLVESRGMSAADVARALDVSRSAATNYLNGKMLPRQERVGKLAEILGVEVEDLFRPRNDGPIDERYHRRIPILGSVPAGDPSDPPDINDVIGFESVLAEAANGKTLFALTVNGDSMWPTLVHGETVIVQVQNNFFDGDIVVADIDGGTTIKRLRKSSQGIILCPDNPGFEVYYFLGKDIKSKRLRLIGRVIEARKRL